MTVISIISLVFAGLLFELTAIQRVTHHEIQSIMFHSIASGLMTYALYVILMPRFKHHALGFYAFMYGLCFFIPVFGMFISAWISMALCYKRTAVHKYSETIANTINFTHIKPISVAYGAGGVIHHVFNQHESAIERTKALCVLGQYQATELNRSIYKLLPDPSDEIRLLAFHILDEEEGAIARNIQSILTTLKDTTQRTAQAKLHKNLAMLYWDLIYKQLIMPELIPVILEKAMHYAIIAKEQLPEDAALWALLGKMHQRLGQPQAAEVAFTKAMALHSPAAHVLPYLAEIHYHLRDYAMVYNDLNQSIALLDIPTIAPIKRFWIT